MSGLADVILGSSDDTSRVAQLRQGIVTVANPLSVLVGAATSSLACRTLASYVPTVGDAVSVLVITGDRLVLGRSNVSGGGAPVDPSQFVKKTGDEMSGPLYVTASTGGIGGSQLVVRNPTVSAEGGQITLIQGDDWGRSWNIDTYNSTLRIHDGSNIPLTVAAGVIGMTGRLEFIGYGGGWFMQDGTWIRAYGGKGIYTSGIMQCDGNMNVGGGLSVGHIACRTIDTADGYRVVSNGGYNGYWANGAFLAQLTIGGDRVHYGMHPGGVAKTMGMQPNNGYVQFWNEDASGYAQLYAYDITQVSQRRRKQDVAAWPPRSAGSAVMGAASRLALIDVVTYRQTEATALIDAETMDRHECGPETCGGSDEEPCHRVREWQNPMLGIIIEDLATVLPEAVGLDPDGNPGGLRHGSMLGFLLAVCKEQQDRIEQLEESRYAA